MTNAFNYVKSGNDPTFKSNKLRSNETYPYSAMSAPCHSDTGNTHVGILSSRSYRYYDNGVDREVIL